MILRSQHVALVIMAAAHILSIEFLISTRAYEIVSSGLALRLDRVFSTGTSGSADMMVLFLVGSLFYVGYLLLLWRTVEVDSSRALLSILVLASLILNAALISRVRLGGDVVRNLSFASAFLKGYNPYAITGTQLNNLIRTGKVNAPLVAEYLDHRFDYPPVTLHYYAAVLLSTGNFLWASVLTEVGLTSMRFAGALLMYKICRSQAIPYLLPVGLYLMNPVMIYSSYGGKEEALFVTLSILSLYLVGSGKSVKAGVAAALSTLVKYVSVVYWPILAFYTRKTKPILLLSIAYVVTILAFSLPFLPSSPFVFTFVSYQLSRPCNSLLNLLCYDPSHPFSSGRVIAAIAYLGIFSMLAISFRSEKGFFQMTCMITVATILVIMFGRSFFIWYLDWFSVSIYFSQSRKLFHYLLPLMLPLIAVPSLFG